MKHWDFKYLHILCVRCAFPKSNEGTEIHMELINALQHHDCEIVILGTVKQVVSIFVSCSRRAIRTINPVVSQKIRIQMTTSMHVNYSENARSFEVNSICLLRMCYDCSPHLSTPHSSISSWSLVFGKKTTPVYNNQVCTSNSISREDMPVP